MCKGTFGTNRSVITVHCKGIAKSGPPLLFVRIVTIVANGQAERFLGWRRVNVALKQL